MNEPNWTYNVGDRVERRGPGYNFPGVVIGRGLKLNGERRLYMVECELPGVAGCVHVFGERDLQPQEGHVDE